MWKVSFPEQQQHVERAAAHEREAASCSYAPEPSLFYRMFPYHFVLDKDLRVVQVGGWVGYAPEHRRYTNFPPDTLS